MTFEELYRTYSADILRFSIWLARDRGEAEDLAAETFVRAWAQRDRLNTETLKAYLLKIARNCYLSSRRKARNHQELSVEMLDPFPDPEQLTASRIEFDRVAKSMMRLSLTRKRSARSRYE